MPAPTTLAGALADPSSTPIGTAGAAAVALGAPADATATTDGGTFSLIALFKRALGYLQTIAGNAASSAPSAVQQRCPDYETIAASATAQIMGTTGAAGDYLSHVTIQPASVSPGAFTIKDGSTTVYSFPGGTNSLLTLHPFHVPLGLTAVTAWKIDTGANVSGVAVGDFT
jgi:hypothetical protein